MRIKILKYRTMLVSLLIGVFLSSGLLETQFCFAKDQPNKEERREISELADEIAGTVLFVRNDRVRTQKFGEWDSNDLGEGEAARWSPDGKKIAVYNDEEIIIMNSDGSDRRRLCNDADQLEDGCPIEFHTNGEEIFFIKRKSGLWAVRIDDGSERRLDLPGRYTGEPNISADGRRLAIRADHDLYAVDLANGSHRKFARGCAPCVSPSGKWLIHNIGSHRQMVVESWDGSQKRRIDARLQSDRSWDDFHWSNHEDFVVVQGEGRREEAHVVNVSTGEAVRVTWDGRIRMPDLFISKVSR